LIQCSLDTLSDGEWQIDQRVVNGWYCPDFPVATDSQTTHKVWVSHESG